MLAESLALSPAALSPAAAPPAAGPAWLFFLSLAAVVFLVIPALAWMLRRQLPKTRRQSIRLDPVTFGVSQKSLRSPRHAVRQHRTLLTTVLVGVLALLVFPGLIALPALGVSMLQVAIGFVVPTFVIALHARQRDASR